MKKNYFLFVLLLCIFNSVFSQQQLFTNQPKDSVVRQDSRISAMQFVPGEMLIKFRDEVNVNLSYKGTKAQTGIGSVDYILAKYNVTNAERLFPKEKRQTSKVLLKAYNGTTFAKPSLHNIYKLKFTSQEDMFSLIDTLKMDTVNVVYAEPNYLMTITNDKPISPILTEKEMLEYLKTNQSSAVTSASDNSTNSKNLKSTSINDPLYSQQWYIPAVHADEVWDSVNGKDTTQIIAILDTGVDWLHPDLVNKIWTNPGEIPNNGIDDDNNGKIDDVRGWDWINNDNNPMDDNSHGTHVAGIAAAQANNGIGISGVSHGAKIMSLKVFQSSGRADAATITQGIIYATQKGATVLNMSFGSYTRSLTMEDALANAYANVILVAAAGNDGYNLDKACIPYVPFFPAALSFVLGVTAPDGGFSNYDCTGPTYSTWADLWNYEMKAPGTNILSTIPNGNYRIYQGTSMAAPVISGSIAMYRSIRTGESMELMWVKLIQSTTTFLNLYQALNIVPAPEIRLISQTMVDTIIGDDNDGNVDAGETIQFWFSARNTGGQCDSTWFKIRLHEFEDTANVNFIKPMSYIGSMSAYASLTSMFDPMKIKISPNVAHDRDIVFDLLMWYKGSIDTTIQQVILKVENGQHVSGILLQDMTFTPDKLWIINSSFRIGEGVTLTILPGTHVEVNSYVDNRGTVSAIGVADTMIYFKNRNIGQNAIYKYVNFQSCNIYTNIPLEHCVIIDCQFVEPPNSIYCDINNVGWYTGNKENCNIKNIFLMLVSTKIEFCNIYNSRGVNPQPNSDIKSIYSVFDRAIGNHNAAESYSAWFLYDPYNPNLNLVGNSFLSSEYMVCTRGSETYVNLQNQYWGSTDIVKIKKKYKDFNDDASIPYLIIEPKLTIPSDSCHAHVWKILVNNKDAQDEYVDPVGVGLQRFDVYFNREMDTVFTPQLSFGVRFPYSQQVVADSGHWDVSHKIWTAYKNIQLFTGDGINRIRVAGAKEANGWEWEIPIEDSRFEFIINAAGSSSIDFTATPGLGKIKLEWNNTGIEDLLGFNMYRFQNITDTTFTDPILTNSELITDTLYTDFNVIPGTHYYYYYKILRTDFSESDSSHIANAIPITASQGDANGDLSVNVLDITTIASYLLNQNPQPFIFEAADVNSSNSVNILDLIGVVNLITGTKSTIGDVIGTNPIPAYIYLKSDRIQFKSDAQVAGLQFTLKGSNMKDVKISSLVAGFEFAFTATDTSVTGILFSFYGKTIAAGMQDILKIDAGNAILNWGEVTGGGKNGEYVTIIKEGEIENLIIDLNLKAYPNPTTGDVTISFNMPDEAKVNIQVFNLFGQLVENLKDATLEKGNHQLKWRTGKSGIYICRLQATANNNKKNIFTKEIKLIVIN